MSIPHHSNLRKFFIEPQQYAKTGTVKARLAVADEKVETIIDGKLETTNTAKGGEALITGARGEHYLVPADTFATHYEGLQLGARDQEYQDSGAVWASQWSHEPTHFIAPWGEEMLIEKGDYLCSTTRHPNELYRIEAQAFALTYHPVDHEITAKLWVSPSYDALSRHHAQATGFNR